jgi:two-component system cell cycle response regulator DivK
MDGVPNRGKKILIVEDNVLNMKLCVDLLEAHGYRTVQTDDGREAVALARAQQPDLGSRLN